MGVPKPTIILTEFKIFNSITHTQNEDLTGHSHKKEMLKLTAGEILSSIESSSAAKFFISIEDWMWLNCQMGFKWKSNPSRG